MPVNYDEPLTFGRNGTVRSLETTGLDFSENDSQSWTIAPVVDIELPLAYRRGGIVMDIEATPFIFPDVVLLYQPAETMTHWPHNPVMAGAGPPSTISVVAAKESRGCRPTPA